MPKTTVSMKEMMTWHYRTGPLKWLGRVFVPLSLFHLFYIILIIGIILTIETCSAAGNIALVVSIRTWVRSQVPVTLSSIFPSAYYMLFSSKGLPCTSNIQPMDTLLPRSNAQSKETHGAPSDAATLDPGARIGLINLWA